jgi:hypothetical protein
MKEVRNFWLNRAKLRQKIVREKKKPANIPGIYTLDDLTYFKNNLFNPMTFPTK